MGETPSAFQTELLEVLRRLDAELERCNYRVEQARQARDAKLKERETIEAALAIHRRAQEQEEEQTQIQGQ